MKQALPVLLALTATAAAAAPSLDQMRHHRRVLLVAAPRADDPALIRQRRMIADWGAGRTDRDVSVVEVIGERVRGAGDEAKALRRARHLAEGSFTVLLIGKDGHEAARSADPFSGRDLAARIDAMPMRRAGGR